MTKHAVALAVTPCLHIECKFWLGDDGWNGSSEHPAISVQAGSFEHAKADMEFAFRQTHRIAFGEKQSND